MGLLTKRISISFSSSKIKIVSNSRLVLSENAQIAFDDSYRMIAIGNEANRQKHNTIINPVKGGIITDFNAFELLLRNLIKKSQGIKGKRLFSPSFKSFCIIPDFSTEIEVRAVRDAFEHAGSKENYMIYSSYAIIEGIGNLDKNDSFLLIDAGAGKIAFSVIIKDEIKEVSSLNFGSNKLKELLNFKIKAKYDIKCEEDIIEELLHNYISFVEYPKTDNLRIKAVDSAGRNKSYDIDLRYLNDSLLAYFDIIRNEVLIILDKFAHGSTKSINYSIITGGFSKILGFEEAISELTGLSVKNKSNDDYALKGLMKLDSNFEKNKKCVR